MQNNNFKKGLIYLFIFIKLSVIFYNVFQLLFLKEIKHK